MIIGVPTEIKPQEKRVALTPAGVAAFRRRGHKILVQAGAGMGSGFDDHSYSDAGARVVKSAARVWASELVLKVKEPQFSEFDFFRPGLVIFTYLHLAAARRLTEKLLARKVTGFGYETIQLEDGSLPLLAPMSEVAGRLAIQVGAWCLEARNGGRGILLGGAAGVRPGRVLILGGGIAGNSACHVAVGIGADVTIMDINVSRLRYLHDVFGGQVTTVMSDHVAIEEEAVQADLVVGAVLVPGAIAPRLITKPTVRRMKRGAALVDLSIDQGGTAETSRPTTHTRPIYMSEGVVHYCVTNMPGAVPHTSTQALTNVTLPYALEIADRGVIRAGEASYAIRHGLNTYSGKLTHPAVANAFKLSAYSPWE